MEFIDKDSLVCTFCGKKPVVGYTFAVDAEIDLETGGREVCWTGTFSPELVKDSIIATCKEHLPILQEQFEKEVKGAEFIGDMDKDE